MACKYKVLCESCGKNKECIGYNSRPTNIILDSPGCCKYNKITGICYLTMERTCKVEGKYSIIPQTDES
jgi:hypothetical protein